MIEFVSVLGVLAFGYGLYASWKADGYREERDRSRDALTAFNDFLYEYVQDYDYMYELESDFEQEEDEKCK